jgi:N-formylglutamate deformylase
MVQNNQQTNPSFTLIKGSVPLLISMPHNGQAIPADIAATMQPFAVDVADTDWYIDKLYDFAESLGAYIIKPNYNRYVIDLNRNKNNENLYPGANSTELCPSSSFNLNALYLDGKAPDNAEIERRIALFWQPYHHALADTLDEIKQQFGKAVLLEAHSILSHVPRFFAGQLPDFNFGTADGASCDNQLLEQVKQLDFSPYSMISNGRFKGGFITREYGQPQQNIHALQLELSQRTYMVEPTNQYHSIEADKVKIKLKDLVTTLIAFAQSN